MQHIDTRGQMRPVSGHWKVSDQINVFNAQQRDIYQSPMEPSFVSWAILWKEVDGTLKLSFTEATGDPGAWPPVMNFNSRDTEYYLKTLVSHDGGESWADTNWREDLDDLWEFNSDHHIRHVFQMQDGTLLRNYPHTIQGKTKLGLEVVYDESKALSPFPFSVNYPEGRHYKFPTTWRSIDGGQAWEQVHVTTNEPPFFPGAIHQLRNGAVVALGAIREEEVRLWSLPIAISESSDGGHTWSEPQVIINNDDMLAPQCMGEENDFVELSDGRLLVILRTDGAGINMLQTYLTRDESGKWRAEKLTTGPQFLHGGYPHMHRASDGTIFYYSAISILYSCDDGASWQSIPLGYSYYGELVEASPGRIVAITQKNIQDCPYPWKNDSSMCQTSFHYQRTAVIEQTDAALLGVTSEIGAENYENFHVCAQIRADGESGLAFCIRGDSYGFAALVIPCNEFRAPGRAAGKEQDALLVIGKSEAGEVTITRKIWVGKVVPGASIDQFNFPHTTWVEMQLDMSGGLLKAAIKTSDGNYMTGHSPVTYAVVRDEFDGGGKLGLFTNRSTGAFKNIRIGAGGTEIRSNWGISCKNAKGIG